MTKVCFLQTSYNNDILLEHLKKMTPGRKGIWKNIEGITDPDKADYVVIIDYNREWEDKIPAEKKIYIGAHAYAHTSYVNYDDRKCVAKLDQRDTFGFGEWWLDEDYDTLSAMEPPKKTKDLSCIMTNERNHVNHRVRIEYMIEFCKQYSDKVDLYGRIHPELPKEQSLADSYKGLLGIDKGHPNWGTHYWFGKRKALEPYRHSLEFVKRTNANYWGERFFDSMLMWCCPIYSGAIGLEKYIPKNSFVYLDVFSTTPKEVMDTVNSDFREKNIKDIAEARNLMLNKYQIWSRIWETINNL